MGPHARVTAAVTAVLVVVAIFAYKHKERIKCKAYGTCEGFVGAFARSPGMQNCLTFADAEGRYPTFNRCSYL
jgi:hypothetical protein